MNFCNLTGSVLLTSSSFDQVSARIFCFSLTDFRPPFIEFEAWFTRDWATSQTKMGSSTKTSEKSCNERIICGFNKGLFTSKKDFTVKYHYILYTLTTSYSYVPAKWKFLVFNCNRNGKIHCSWCSEESGHFKNKIRLGFGISCRASASQRAVTKLQVTIFITQSSKSAGEVRSQSINFVDRCTTV